MSAFWVPGALKVAMSRLAAAAGSVARSAEAVADGAKAAEANLNLGVAYFRAGNLQLAKDKLERARDQDPRNATVHGALGLAGGAGQWVLICLRHRFSSDLRLRSSSLIRHLPELV